MAKTLDEIDLKILSEIQADGRITNVELAKRVGISPPPCLRRVRALEAAGLIRGYHADLAPEPLGFMVTVFAQIGLASQAESDLRAFETLVLSWPEVREAQAKAEAKREASSPAEPDPYAKIIGAAVRGIQEDRAAGQDETYWKERDRGKGWERDQ